MRDRGRSPLAVLRPRKVAVGPPTDDEVKGIQTYGGLENLEEALREWIEA